MAYSNCSGISSLGNGWRTKGTETGNAMSSTQIVAKVCDKIAEAHGVSVGASCQSGVVDTSFSVALGVPDKALNPFRTTMEAERAGAIQADALALEECLAKIQGLSAVSAEVQAAYQADAFDPWVNVVDMIPAQGCEDVFADNQIDPLEPGTAPMGFELMDFDFPAPPNAYKYMRIQGVFGFIDFGEKWYWHTAFSGATTAHIYTWDQVASFSFSGGARVLKSLSVYAKSKGGQVIIRDENGQEVRAEIPFDNRLHVVETGFSTPSNRIEVEFSEALEFGVDDIVASEVSHDPAVYFIQGRSHMITDAVNELELQSPVRAGSVILVQVNFTEVAKLERVGDSLGNTYHALSPALVSPDKGFQQVFWAESESEGKLRVAAYFDVARYNYNGIHVFEYGGVDLTNPIAQVKSATGLGAEVIGPEMLIDLAGQLLFAAVVSDTGPASPGVGFAKRNTVILDLSMDRQLTSPGVYRAQALRDKSEEGWLVQSVVLNPK
jgi:hypothetical protein